MRTNHTRSALSPRLRRALCTAALLTLSHVVAADDCPDGNPRCRAAQERAEQQQQQNEQPPADARKQQPAPGQTGGAARWDPDAEQKDESKPDEQGL